MSRARAEEQADKIDDTQLGSNLKDFAPMAGTQVSHWARGSRLHRRS